MTLSFPKLIFTATLQFSLISIFACSAHAQDRSDARVFEPDFFESYATRTAFDMVSRVPGFQIQSADARRGLGQGGANILINGERLTGKSDPVEQLGRITATSVLRIEILDGASLDIPGLSGQVANVITQNSGVSGTWQWNPEWRKGLDANLSNFEASLSGETGDLSYSVKVRDYAFRRGNHGPETLTNPQGVVFEIRDEDGQYYADRPGASVNLTYKPKDDHVANLNAEYSLFDFSGRDISRREAQTDEGQTLQTIFINSEDVWNAEVSGDYEFPFVKGKLKLIGLHRAEHVDALAQFEIFEIGASTASSRFLRAIDEAESILRSEYSWAPQEGRGWTLGIEGALNSVEINSQFVERNDSGSFLGDTAELSSVDEERVELTLTHSRSLSPKWDVQASLGAEYSQLSQKSNISFEVNRREFYRPKGFAAATYKVDDSFAIRSKIEREVGQLNFSDFISSVNLTDNLDQAGNPDLVPSQSWLSEVEFDKNYGQGNSFKARFYGAQISDLVDRIPIGIDGDAIGNIDTAYQYGVDLSTTIKGQKWGLEGTELNLRLDLRGSSVEDPLQGFKRDLNENKKLFYSFDFRHDIPNTEWAYGLVFDRLIQAEVYRLTTEELFTFSKPFTVFYVEYKDIAGMKFKLSGRNLLNSVERLDRSFYDNRRDLGQIERIERSERTFDPYLRLEVSGTF